MGILLYLSAMLRSWRYILYAVLMAWSAMPAWAQEAPLRRTPALQVGLGLVGLTYKGDLNYKSESYYRLNTGVRVSLQFDNQRRVSPQLGLMLAGFTAQNRDLGPTDGVQPNTFVRTGLLAVDMRLLVRILKDTRARPYVGLGLGLLAFTPRDAEGNNLVSNLNTRREEETYGNLTAQFPLVLGCQYRVNELVALGIELVHQPTGTDYLDNISALGPRSGNDRLQSLTLSLLLTPGQKQRQGRR
jgi:hypothetical protein